MLVPENIREDTKLESDKLVIKALGFLTDGYNLEHITVYFSWNNPVTSIPLILKA